MSQPKKFSLHHILNGQTKKISAFHLKPCNKNNVSLNKSADSISFINRDSKNSVEEKKKSWENSGLDNNQYGGAENFSLQPVPKNLTKL